MEHVKSISLFPDGSRCVKLADARARKTHLDVRTQIHTTSTCLPRCLQTISRFSAWMATEPNYFHPWRIFTYSRCMTHLRLLRVLYDIAARFRRSNKASGKVYLSHPLTYKTKDGEETHPRSLSGEQILAHTSSCDRLRSTSSSDLLNPGNGNLDDPLGKHLLICAVVVSQIVSDVFKVAPSND